MCEFCEGKMIFEKNILDDWPIGWGVECINIDNATYSKYKVFIDRGFLRLVDEDDCQCMDHGESIKIKYCPFCGADMTSAVD